MELLLGQVTTAPLFEAEDVKDYAIESEGENSRNNDPEIVRPESPIIILRGDPALKTCKLIHKLSSESENRDLPRHLLA